MVIPSLPQFLSATAFHGITDFGIKDFWGHFGVALFFLVSGFVIPFSVATQSQGAFATSRIFRIWPTYVTGLVITILCIKFNSEHASVAFPYTTIEILKHILIVPRWPTLTRPIDGIIWTLEVEVFFYAFCLLMMQRLRHFDQKIFLIGLLCVPAAIAVTRA